MPTGRSVIHWFRRDLRLYDNSALTAALDSGDPVLPVFLLDRVLLARPTVGERRRRFLRTALRDLDRQLRARGGRLLVLGTEDVARELNRLAHDSGAWAVYFNRDYTPYGRERDTRTTRGMQMTGIVTMAFDDLDLVAPYRTLDEEGRLPATFEDYFRRWLDVLDLPSSPPEPNAAAGFTPFGEVPASTAGWEPELLADPTDSTWPGASRPLALGRLDAFAFTALAGYGEGPALAPEATSRLSAALKFGTLSVREVARGVIELGGHRPDAAEGIERYLMALARRDFAHHLLFADPAPARPGAGTEGGGAAFDAWAEGRSGLPLADAAMRHLAAEGWIPEPARAAAAVALVQVLGVPWPRGADHFMRHLVDAEVAANAIAWRAVAGATGADAAVAADRWADAAELHDPDGAYVRRWVPELAGMPGEWVHRPWQAPVEVQEAAECVVGRDYPAPVAGAG
ncbi:MAG TPA: FAD-binding domain-containing protein [Candidatus Dormibacteraeota bacterium]|nr:FAD-binding domain-containing protein [Candidatus Dormibacteraeota bacterium]